MTEYYASQMEQQMAMELLSGFLAVVLTVALLVMLWNIASYVLEAVGLAAIARRRGLKNPWMAWVPVLNYWLLGSVSDQYRYVVKGQIRNRRIVLVVLVAVSTVIGWISSGSTLGSLETVAELFSAGRPVYGVTVGGAVGAAVLLGLATLVVNIVLAVFRYMTLYDIYTSCDPQNNVLYLLLSIFFAFLTPVFLFANRNKDGGMPPRREQPVYHNPVEEFAEV